MTASSAPNQQMTSHRSDCRVCGTRVRPFLDLGVTPLANGFIRPEDLSKQEPAFPLDAYFCANCGHVQLGEVISPEFLFSDYIYVSGTSEHLRQHFAGLAEELISRQWLQPGQLVVEIASNDGTLLNEFRVRGHRAIGVDPATNLAQKASEQGLETVNAFFNSQTAADVKAKYGPAKVITGSNVMGHVDDVQDFVRGISLLLDDDGLVCIEVPHLERLIEKLAYDTIYHEHVSYFSIRSASELFKSANLKVFDVAPQEIHGGTIRLFARKAEGDEPEVTPRYSQLLAEERDHRLMQFELFEDFARKVSNFRTELRSTLFGLKAEGKRIAGYGAAAKGNTLLSYCGLDSSVVEFIADRSPLKQGLYTPGSHIPVVPAEELERSRPDYVLLLAWNFADEIIEQQRSYLEHGGKFILPFPTPRVIEAVGR